MNTIFADYLSDFLREYLPRERRASVHTCETYAYTFQLLVCFAANRFKTRPSSLTLEQLNVQCILAFLDHLETDRGNLPRTRNARLAAIKAFFRFIEYREASCLAQASCIQAIPVKKTDEKLVDYLTLAEMQAVLDAPDPQTRSGIRDRAMIYLAYSGGLRVSELIGLKVDQFEIHPSPTIHVFGKGRRERVLPLWKETSTALRAWLTIRGNETTVKELFLNAQGKEMSRSGFEYILLKHVKSAMVAQPSIEKKRISPHILRHTCAMHIMKATRDIRKVSLWLGHADLKSTQIYLRADPCEKLETLENGIPMSLRPGIFKAPDKLMEMLRSKT